MPRVVFLHPDLGIGGAERLVVDAALALKGAGHEVAFLTSHHDKSHCFEETKDGNLPVTVAGDWIPRSIFGKCHAIFAYVRVLYCAIYLVYFSNLQPDVVLCDLVSVAVPVLKRSKAKVIYYCHHPDQLLSPPGNILKKIYRIPIDWLEERTTKLADKILVNSKYTGQVFKETFSSIEKAPDVLYPSLNENFFDSIIAKNLKDVLPFPVKHDSFIFLSINRYERKKNLKLAVAALKELENLVSPSEYEQTYLVIAGGYDKRNNENISHFTELLQHTSELELDEKVIFLKSPSDVDKISLLKSSLCLIYTPSNEHYGIVPIEAMYLNVPVIAVNSGGPKETIVNDKTGFLCEPTPNDFAYAMSRFIKDKKLSLTFGVNGRNRVIKNFSFNAFSKKLDNIVNNVLHQNK